MMDLGGDEEEVEEGAPAWMSTFSDMATLLLTFFVLLLSFANMDVVEFRTMMGSVRDAFGVQHETPGDFMARANSPVTVAPGGSPANPSVLENSLAIDRLLHRLEEEGLETVVDVEATQRGLVLRIRDAVLFPSGSDQLLPAGLPVLTRIAAISTEFTQELAIEGHTDDRPISTARFPSNWELSAARALAVLRHLETTGLAPEAMSIAGYADTRPVGDNEGDEGRARNRRVEFVFVRWAMNEPDPEAGEGEAPEGGAEAGAEGASAQAEPEPPAADPESAEPARIARAAR